MPQAVKSNSFVESAKRHAKPKKRPDPVWKGPEKDGITFSLLSRFLTCRERFRLLVVEGLQPGDRFNHRIEYGNMWHVCEEALAGRSQDWHGALTVYCQNLLRKYPMQQKDVSRWYDICRMQFPLYVEHWSRHPDVQERTPLLQEQSFCVPYRLPSGRVVKLRGKWDSVDLIGKGKSAGIYLQENKTKGDINEDHLKRQLTFDLQTMIYLVALSYDKEKSQWTGYKGPILGVRYNVVRRPLSGGKGTIKQSEGTAGAKCTKCKNDDQAKLICPKCEGQGRIGGKPPETDEEFMERLRAYIVAEPEAFFMRWKIEVSPEDIAKFRRECLDPILEQLCDWWQYMSMGGDPFKGWNPGNRPRYDHYRMPFGIYSPLLDGGVTDMDEYLATGSDAGLRRTANLFPELT